MKAVVAKSISFQYKGQTVPVLKDISFELEKGQIAAVTGPSGCGKSTLGYCICGVIPHLIKGDFEGKVTLQGRVGIVFQDPDAQIFLPTVEDELAFGPENLCLNRDQIGARITSTLELLGISHLRYKKPAELSGGEKQLVALGGVLTLSPDIIVLDEPMSQLDAISQQRVKIILRDLKKQGASFIIIDHDKSNLTIADQIWFLDRGQLSLLSS